jgi:hypothetical protein
MVSRYAFTEMPHMYMMLDDAYQDKVAAHIITAAHFFQSVNIRQKNIL